MINGKIAVHVRAPLLSIAGYGGHSREVVDYLLTQQDKFLVFVESVNWGNCGNVHDFNFEDKERMQRYYQCIGNYEQAKRQNVQFDISIQVTIPNEFSRRAQFNIGVTAGIEVDRCTLDWVRKCNEMDLIVVPSTFSKNVLQNTVYTGTTQDGRTVEERIQRPIEVIGQYFDKPKTIPKTKFNFTTSKNLLFVGMWGNKGGYGEDRKNVANLIRMFLSHFGNDPDCGLILKTNIITDSPEDLHHTKEKIKQIKSNFPDAKAKIYLIHENLSDTEMYSLYSSNSILGMVSLTCGEGFGRPLLEAASCGMPVLATNWSGHLDFLREKHGFLPISYQLKEVPECQVWKGVIDKGSLWANIQEESFKARVEKFFKSSYPVRKAAKENIAWLEENFSKDAVHEKWTKLFDSIIKPVLPEELEHITDERIIAAIRRERMVEQEVEILVEEYKIEKNDKKKVLFIMPRSFGDIVICTSIVNSLKSQVHVDDEFYFATSPEYFELLDALVEKHGIKVINYTEKLMSTEVVRKIWDYVYNPGLNVQYVWSNWTLGNGELGVKLLEEFAKNCNLSPESIMDFCLPQTKCQIPNTQYITITPVTSKQSKDYKHWDDVVFNIKKMAPDLKIVQLGMKSEKLLDGVEDYRGKTFNETIYVISRSILNLSPDTGTAHVSAALGVPHIVLFGSTGHEQCAPILFSNNVAQIIIDSNKACEPRCYKDVCCKMPDGKNCLSHISPETVSNQVMTMLSGIKTGKIHLPVLRLDAKKLEEETDKWHDSQGEKDSLSKTLGLSEEHYARYVEMNYEELK